ncbi:hypothetical protein GQ600_21042 [Phytophthora cactorum]|nr:hypothetical protein GQ600_21042 [Phytophthora cactorum]
MKQSGYARRDYEGPDENSGSSDSDAVSEIEPADLIDTMRMIREMEQHDHNRSVAGANTTCTGRQPAAQCDELLHCYENTDADLGAKTDPLTTESASPKQASLLTKAAVKPNNLLTKAQQSKKSVDEGDCSPQEKKSKSTTAARKNDKIKFCSPHSQTSTQSAQEAGCKLRKNPNLSSDYPTRQEGASTLTSFRRRGARQGDTGQLPCIMTDEFMGARSARSRRSYVHSDELDYNFVVPKHVVTKLNAVVEEERNKQSKPSYFANARSQNTLKVQQTRS